MAEPRKTPEQPVASPDDEGVHPTEPAEGAREPGEMTDAGRPAPTEEPAEGKRP